MIVLKIIGIIAAVGFSAFLLGFVVYCVGALIALGVDAAHQLFDW